MAGFEDALKWLKAGDRVRRDSWFGSGFLRLNKTFHRIEVVNGDGSVDEWVMDNDDLLAENWFVC